MYFECYVWYTWLLGRQSSPFSLDKWEVGLDIFPKFVVKNPNLFQFLAIDSEGMVNLLGYLPKSLIRAKYNEDELKSKIKKASTLDTMQKMLSRLSIQCFHKCVPKPEDSLDIRQRLCISMCMDRYMDSYTLVARAFGNRLQAELRETLAQQQAQDQSWWATHDMAAAAAFAAAATSFGSWEQAVRC